MTIEEQIIDAATLESMFLSELLEQVRGGPFETFITQKGDTAWHIANALLDEHENNREDLKY